MRRTIVIKLMGKVVYLTDMRDMAMEDQDLKKAWEAVQQNNSTEQSAIYCLKRIANFGWKEA